MCVFFNDTATTEIYTLSLHDALPICLRPSARRDPGEDHDDSEALGDRKRHSTNHAVKIIHAKDRKSTRLNSSHANISYAVFCLKKKNNDNYRHNTHTRT